jgi:hypothetical protein
VVDSIGDPASIGQFFDELLIRRVRFTSREFTVGSANLENYIVAEIAPRLWTADIETAQCDLATAKRQRALLRRVGSLGRFIAYNPDNAYPENDPTGSDLAGYSPVIYAVHSGNRALRLSSLPPGYELVAGDMVSIYYAGRRQLLDIAEDATASSGGITPYFDVSQPLRTSIAAGMAADLAKPGCQMQLVGYDPGASELRIADGMTLQAIEVIS